MNRQLVLKLYIATVILVGALSFFIAGIPLTATEWIGVLAFGLLSLLGEAMAISMLSNATVSVSFVPVFASILLFQPVVGVWVAALGSLSWDDLKNKPWYRNLFNLCQLGISAALSAHAYRLLGGQPGQVTRQSLLSIVGAFVVYYLANTAIPTVAIALSSGNRPSLVYYRLIAWSTPGFVAIAPLAILVAVVFEPLGYVGVVLFTLPLLSARAAFKMYRDMRLTYIETIQSLAQAIDAKDHYTLGHSERVAYYSLEIARRLGWKQNQLDQLFFTALLHDIGKIGIQESILNKTGRLTADERADVNKHPQLGAEIVGKVSFLRKEADYIRYHHEHFAGTGYPKGLSGEDIPLGARIIAVADSFDAMTSQRSYHSPRSVAEALEELDRCSGSQFDPEVVKAFYKVVDFNTDILEASRQAAAAGFSLLAGLNER